MHKLPIAYEAIDSNALPVYIKQKNKPNYTRKQMIHDIPNAEDFYQAGKELFDIAWDMSVSLLCDLDEASYLGWNPEEISEEYWDASKRRLSSALSIVQQGVELCLKGKIAAISPYLLIADPPKNWSKISKKTEAYFSEFKTIDAQELIVAHDTFAEEKLDPEFAQKFKGIRKTRNIITHSIDKKLAVSVAQVIEYILYSYKNLFPNNHWITERINLYSSSPEVILGGPDFIHNRICWEVSTVITLLTKDKVKIYFNIDKKGKPYYCPECYYLADKTADFEHKLGRIETEDEKHMLYCPVCNKRYDVKTMSCDDCGNTFTDEDGMCLLCYEYCENIK